MKLCVVSHAYLSLERAAWLEELSGSWEIHVIVPRTYNKMLGVETVDTSRPDKINFKYHPLELDYLLGKRGSTKFILRGLLPLVRQISPDVLYVENEWHSLLTLQCLLAGKLTSVSYFGVFSWANLRAGTVKETALSMIRRAVFPAVDFFVAGNQANISLLLDYGVARGRITLMPQYGTDTSKFCKLTDSRRTELRKEYGIPPGRFLLGYVGRLVEEKGILTIARAYRMLLREHDDFHLCIVGSGPSKERLLEELEGLPYTLIEGKGAAEMPEVIGMLDMLLLASYRRNGWTEQFGRVLAEAMSCGVVPVGAKSGAIPEVIGTEELLFEPGNPEDLVRVVNRFAFDRKSLQEYGDRCRMIVEEKYSNSAIARTFSGVLESKFLKSH